MVIRPSAPKLRDATRIDFALFNNRRPQDLLTSIEGIQRVENTLVRIEHKIFPDAFAALGKTTRANSKSKFDTKYLAV